MKTGLPLMPATGPVSLFVASSALQMMTGRWGPMKFSAMPTTCIGKLSTRLPETVVCHSPNMPGLISDSGMIGVSSAARARAGHSMAKMTAQKHGIEALNFIGSKSHLIYRR